MTNVAFRAVDDPPGLEVRDRVSKRRFALRTSGVPELTSADTEPFPFPVEAACRFVTDEIRVPELTCISIRDTAGEQVTAVDQEDAEQLSRGKYVVELDGRVKTYLHVDARLAVETGDDYAVVRFGAAVDVVIGARARIRRPPTTVTTTPDLDDVRLAVEAMSSSLQTTSPERSFPTLRGYPPRLRLGDKLEIPAVAEPPETGITLVVPRELSALFTVAPLSYYLGAAIEFGTNSRLETEGGLAFELGERDVERVLRHAFLLDCLVRTHGLYRQKPVEYEALVPELPLDLPALYDAAPAERLEAYLSVPTSVTDSYVPRWSSVAYVDPSVDRLTALPHLVDDLAFVRTEGVSRHRGEAARRLALSRFVTASGATRSASAVFEGRDVFVDVPETTPRHRVWVGDGIPLNASKFQTAGYEHQLDREPTDHERLRVLVVCNDSSMSAETAAVETRYYPYSDQLIDLDVHEQVTTAELAARLGDDADFFHFIGHATDRGLKCSDGRLDVASVPDVGCDSFLLNACQSYGQGSELVERGAVGGIVTLSDVGNEAAVEVGSRLAQLLNRGVALRNALSIVRELTVVGGQYTLVGDGRTTLQGDGNGTTMAMYLQSRPGGYDLTVDEFLDEIWRLGAQTTWLSPDGWEKRLSGGEVGQHETTVDTLLDMLDSFSSPVWIDGEFHWSTDVTREDLER